MIAIRNQTGQALQLITGQHLTTEWAVGWLADDVLPPNGYSYPIRFPLSDQNKQFLGPGYLPNAATPNQRIPVRVEMAGQLYRQAQLHYRINEGMGDGTLRFDGGEVVPDLKKLTLQQVFTEPVNLAGDITLSGRMKLAAQAEPGVNPFTFFPVRNELFFAADEKEKVKNFVSQPYVNAWNGTTFVTDDLTRTGYPAVPFFFLTWVLEKIVAKVNYRLTGDWVTSPETRRRVILNMTSLRDMNFFAQQIIPGEHLPEISCSEFLKRVRQMFGLMFSWEANTGTCTVRQFADVAADPNPQDMTPYLTGRWGIDLAPQNGYTLEEGRDQQDALFQQPSKAGDKEDVPKDTVTLGAPGPGENVIPLPISTAQVLMTTAPAEGSRWIVPTVRQAGNALGGAYSQSDRYPSPTGKLRNPMNLRLLTFYGMQPDTLGNRYPFASSQVRNTQGQLIGSNGLELVGLTGLWENTLKLYYHFRDQARPATARLRLPVNQLSTLATHRPVTLDFDNTGASRMLVNKIQAEEPDDQDGLCLVRLELLTLPAGLDLPTEPLTEPLWVELIRVGAPTQFTQTGDTIVATDPITLSVRIWEDKARTKISQRGPLSIRIRTIKRVYDLARFIYTDHTEWQTRYVATEDRAVIYKGLTRHTLKPAGEALYTVRTDYTYQIDPSADYNLL